MDDFKEKIVLINTLFGGSSTEENPNEDAVVKHGKYYGGVYNGRKFMYSDMMIRTLTKEKLEAFIRKQIGA